MSNLPRCFPDRPNSAQLVPIREVLEMTVFFAWVVVTEMGDVVEVGAEHEEGQVEMVWTCRCLPDLQVRQMGCQPGGNKDLLDFVAERIGAGQVDMDSLKS
jgi:hypothetical protein